MRALRRTGPVIVIGPVYNRALAERLEVPIARGSVPSRVYQIAALVLALGPKDRVSRLPEGTIPEFSEDTGGCASCRSTKSRRLETQRFMESSSA